MPRAKQRGTSSGSRFCGRLEAPSCLAVYFTWPQVALTHHVFCQRAYTPAGRGLSSGRRRAVFDSRTRAELKISCRRARVLIILAPLPPAPQLITAVTRGRRVRRPTPEGLSMFLARVPSQFKRATYTHVGSQTGAARGRVSLRFFAWLLLLLCAAPYVSGQAPRPVLLSDPNSTRALALDSVIHATEPFAPESPFAWGADRDRKSTRLNSSHANISYAVFCLKKKKYNLSIR